MTAPPAEPITAADATEQLRRQFVVPDLQVRAASKGGDGRVIEGIAVPYGVKQRIHAYLDETFARGAFDHQLRAAHRVRFARDHYRLIGKAVELREDAAGLWGAWRVSATEAGDETLTLVRDGVLTELSVGFRERQNRRLDDGTIPGYKHIERVTADLVEVSVVFEGAYGEAATIAGVRHAGGPPAMPALEQARARLAALPDRSGS